MAIASTAGRYGTIAKNKSINRAIYRCFELIGLSDADTFAKQFRNQPHDGDQVLHTFRELLLGAYLNSVGIPVRYSRPVDRKTPDWSVVEPDLPVTAVVELVNFHAPHRIERAIEERSAAGQVWVSRVPDHSERLISRLDEKAAAYRDIVSRRAIPYVIAVFAEFESILEMRDVENAVTYGDTDWFVSNPTVSGILHLEEHSGTYSFQYLPNPHAARRLHVPHGTLL